MKLSARIVGHQRLGPALFRLRLAAPEVAASARPGQFVMLRVGPGLDPLLARPFSINGVEDGEILVLYRVVGRGTRLLSQAREGGELDLWGPLGTGFDLAVENPILVAGGMGRAPLEFAARLLEDQGKEPQWVHGGPSAPEIQALMDELNERLRTPPRKGDLDGFRRLVAVKAGLEEASAKDFAGTSVYAATEDGSEGHKGLVTGLLADMLAAVPASLPVALLACGPLPMLKAVARMAAERGIPCQVSLEAPMACGIGVCLGCALPAAGGGYVRVCQEGPVMAAERIAWERL